METSARLSFSQYSHWKEVAALSLIAWIPSLPGKVLRRLIYPTVFAQIGSSVQIKRNVEFTNASGIEIGSWAKLESGISLDNRSQHNKILIGERTKLESGVRLYNRGQDNRILIREEAKLDFNVRLQNFGQDSNIWIGKRANLDRGVDIKAHGSGTIEIGEKTFLGPFTCLAGEFIRIGKQCLIASHTGIYSINHNFDDPTTNIREQGVSYKGITIEDDCWLGSGVRVVDGVTIGRGSVIGAGAVVTRDIPPYSIAVGVPARPIGSRKSSELANSV
mgnify:CR=1 FL=1